MVLVSHTWHSCGTAAIVKDLKNKLSAFSSAQLLRIDDWLTVRTVFSLIHRQSTVKRRSWPLSLFVRRKATDKAQVKTLPAATLKLE